MCNCKCALLLCQPRPRSQSYENTDLLVYFCPRREHASCIFGGVKKRRIKPILFPVDCCSSRDSSVSPGLYSMLLLNGERIWKGEYILFPYS